VSAASCAAAADPVADFYRGKQIRVIVRTTVGGGYDTLSRLIARHIGRHLPGEPTTLVQNMPGEELGRMIADLIGSPADLRERVKLAMVAPKDAKQVERAAGRK
jgi:hypothetical protein